VNAARDLPISRDAVADPDVTAADALADIRALHESHAPSAKPATSAAGQSKFHESARAQVRGAATYADDIAELKGTLYAAPIMSKVAHGKLIDIDCSAALAMPGVVAVVGAGPAGLACAHRLAMHGHDVVREGFAVEHGACLCLSSSFGCYDGDKVYLRWDLAERAPSAEALARRGLCRLWPEEPTVYLEAGRIEP